MPRVIVDYCFLTDSGDDDSLTALVMKETMCGSVWAYALSSKSVAEDPWVAEQLVDDMCTVGMARERVVIKSDQEAAIVELQSEVAKRRNYNDYGVGTGIENSKVGDSNSNGKIERAIRDVKNMIRTHRSALEASIKTKVTLSCKILPWLVRHAAYIITRCRVRAHGKTALQVMKGRVSMTELVPFGETVMFKIPKTGASIGSFEDKWDEGIWLGSTIRDGMHLIGTSAGVFKVGTIRRKADGEQWSADNVRNLVGSPSRPDPSTANRRITTFTKAKLDDIDKQPVRFEPPIYANPEPRQLRIERKDILKYGGSTNCPGCRAIESGKAWRTAHSPECRLRIEALMMADPQDRHRIDRITAKLAATGERILESERAEEEEKAPLPGPGEPPQSRSRTVYMRSSGGPPISKEAARERAEVMSEVARAAMSADEVIPPTSAQAESSSPTAAPAATSGPVDAGGTPIAERLRAAAAAAPRASTHRVPKRKASEDHPDDPRLDQGQGAEVIHDPQPGANKRPADVQADDSHRGDMSELSIDQAGVDEQWKGTDREGQHRKQIMEVGPIGELDASGGDGPRTLPPLRPKATLRSVATALESASLPKCDHCEATFETRNLLFKHLYQHHDEDGAEAAMRAASDFDPSTASCAAVRPVMLMEDFRGHPSPILKSDEIDDDELKWKNVGSGMFAKTFRNVDRLPLTSKGGPASSDVYRRVIRSLTTGKVVDDCIVDDVSDEMLKRRMPTADNLRVELIMRGAVAMYESKGADVVELYSQPRIAQEAAVRKYGGTQLKSGWSLDLTMRDPATDLPWDLSKRDVQNKVRRMVVEGKPFMLVGSPPCTAFSQLQGLNSAKRDPKVVKAELAAACAHVAFCFEMYEVQRRAGRYFMHEHPSAASSWNRPEVLEMLLKEDVELVEVDMCHFGMVGSDELGEALVRKRTKVLTNSCEVARRIAQRCDGQHRHIHLVGGRAKKAQLYPRAFSRAVCEGIAAQKRLHGLGLRHRPLMSFDEVTDAVQKLTGKRGPAEDLHEDIEEYATDDQSGAPLDPRLLREARKAEIEYFKSMNVYAKVPISECYAVTGAAPVSTRWVDINKGDSLCPNYRSRLVAREFHTTERPEWYAATPPGETLRVVLSRLATRKGCKLMYADVSRAYFYAPAVRPVYVRLPAEDTEEKDDGMVGRLNMSMYGTRDAAANWASEYGKTLTDAGFVQGKSSPCIFHNSSSDTTVMVHGDDVVGIGKPQELAKLRKVLEDKYKLKVETLSGASEDVQEVKILNKIVRWTPNGLELEADPRHAELVVRELGLEQASVSKVPGVKPSRDGEVTAAMSEELGRDEARRYRAVAARLNYLAPDRVDIGYSVKEAARSMAKPLVGDWDKLKRIGRYLLGKPRLISKFAWQSDIGVVTAYSDSDWAGDKNTCKSTSGGILVIGSHVLKSYSRQQRTVALSSAEAELHGIVAASSEALGLIGLLRDMGLTFEGEIYCDSSAALGIAQRSGVGKLRHVRTQALWVQEVRSEGRLNYKKVLGSRNPSDALTKYMPGVLMEQHLKVIGAEARGGRAESAPTIDSVEPYTIVEIQKKVRFHGSIGFKYIEASGRQRPTASARRTRWSTTAEVLREGPQPQPEEPRHRAGGAAGERAHSAGGDCS